MTFGLEFGAFWMILVLLIFIQIVNTDWGQHEIMGALGGRGSRI
jgi:hypothetical protein